ncbi:MAG: AAA-like domain-containing protein [Myxococcota bacterium]
MTQPPDIVVLEDGRVDLRRQVVERSGSVERLTTLEAQLLGYLAARPSRNVARDALLREVWGFAGRIPRTRAPDFAMGRLRRKIERDPARPQLLLTVFGEGYRFEPVGADPGAELTTVPPPGAAYHRSWYANRPDAEATARQLLDQPCAPVVVLGPPGAGKTWFVEHLVETLPGPGDRVAWLPAPSSSSEAVEQIAVELALAVDLEEARAVASVEGAGRPVRRLGRFLEQVVLPAVGERLFVVVDGLESWPRVSGDDVRMLLQGWSSDRREPWDRLRLVVAEGNRPDRPVHVSSMDLVPPIVLDDLTPTAILGLVERHDLGWTEEQLSTLEARVGGHPRLVATALYEARQGRSIAETLAQAPRPEGPFGPWLRQQLRWIDADPHLRETVRTVLAAPGAELDYLRAHRLERAGILKPDGYGWRIRYSLLAAFLEASRWADVSGPA